MVTRAAEARHDGMLADAMMMGTMTTDKYPPSADLLESVGVKAIKVSEPTTTLSILLGSLGAMVFCDIHATLWNLLLPRLSRYRCHHRPRNPAPGVWAACVVASPGSGFCWVFCPPASQTRPAYMTSKIFVLKLIGTLIGVVYVSSRNGWLGIVGEL